MIVASFDYHGHALRQPIRGVVDQYGKGGVWYVYTPGGGGFNEDFYLVRVDTGDSGFGDVEDTVADSRYGSRFAMDEDDVRAEVREARRDYARAMILLARLADVDHPPTAVSHYASGEASEWLLGGESVYRWQYNRAQGWQRQYKRRLLLRVDEAYQLAEEEGTLRRAENGRYYWTEESWWSTAYNINWFFPRSRWSDVDGDGVAA